MALAPALRALPLAPLVINVLCLSGVSALSATAQIVDQRAFSALDKVLPATEANATTLFLWPGVSKDSLKARPFHVYDADFHDIIGPNPTLTLIAKNESDRLFHEAVTWYEPTDEVFFVQHAGAKVAGTGLAKSGIVQKISLAQAEAVRKQGSGQVDVTVVPSRPQVINPNGASSYKGQIILAGSGQGPDLASALYLMNPREPYNTTVLVNNLFGRQFNSLNDVTVHPASKEIYFTDTFYGHVQEFRPRPGLPHQVYRFDPSTGAVRVVADGFSSPNGITFSPNGRHAYIGDSGVLQGFDDYGLTEPATVYRFDVGEDGTWENRKTFAYIARQFPDGVHCDARGNVYVGTGEGVQVFNPSGKLIGSIFTGITVANFQFAGKGRMVLAAGTELYYVTLAAEGAPVS